MKISLFNEFVIFMKDDKYGLLGIDHLQDVDVLCSFDSSTGKQLRVPILEIEEAKKRWNQSYLENKNRGWKIIYHGERNWG